MSRSNCRRCSSRDRREPELSSFSQAYLPPAQTAATVWFREQGYEKRFDKTMLEKSLASSEKMHVFDANGAVFERAANDIFSG